MLKTFKLKNGIQVATYNLPNLRSIHLRIISKCGSIVEGREKNGVAHLMEHLLVQGIPSLPTVEEFSQFIEILAGSYGAYTDRLRVGFSITLPSTHLEDSIRIASEVFFQPLFTETAMEKERHVVIQEIRQNMDSHWYKISRFFRKTLYKNENLILDPGGTEKIVGKITREDLMEFWQKYFFPKNTYLLVSGKFSQESLTKLLDQYFGKYPGRSNFSLYPRLANNDLVGGKVAIRFDKTLKANYVDFTFPSLDLSQPLKERVEQEVLTTVLGGIRNSRLFKLLRYQRGLVYSVNAGANILPGLGYGYISLEVSSEHLEEVVTLVLSELAAFYQNGPTVEELELVRNYLSNQWLMAFDHPTAITGWIENDLLWNDKVRLPEEYIELINKITVTNLKNLMQKYWDFDKLNLVIQGPTESSKSNIEKFEKMIKGLPKT